MPETGMHTSSGAARPSSPRTGCAGRCCRTVRPAGGPPAPRGWGSGPGAPADGARRAGLAGVVARLPAGWDTPVGRELTGGVNLSGGELQRLALGRALWAVHGGAGVLVLDEPTAALDVRAEAAFYDS